MRCRSPCHFERLATRFNIFALHMAIPCESGAQCCHQYKDDDLPLHLRRRKESQLHCVETVVTLTKMFVYLPRRLRGRTSQSAA